MEQTKNDNLTRIKSLLESGAIINSMIVLRLIGTTEIRHYIAKIRKEIKVLDRWVTKDNKRWKVYWIDISK